MAARPARNPQLRKWALARFNWELGVRTAIVKMTKRQRAALRRAVESRTTTNCWFGEYNILPFLRTLLEDRDKVDQQKALLAARKREAKSLPHGD